MSEFAFPGDPLEIKASEWNQVRRQTKPNSSQAVSVSQWMPESYWAIVTTEVTARSGTTLGVGAAELYTRNDSNQLISRDVIVSVYNADVDVIEVGAVVFVSREYSRRDFCVIRSFKDSCSEKEITDIRVSGNMLQYKQCGDWVTWHTGTDCPS
jgi:hypothetical protein